MKREFTNISLCERNSFHVEQSAERLIEFDDVDDLRQIFGNGSIGRWMVLSGGNNILFTQDYDGTLITPKASAIEILSDTDGVVRVNVAAGVEWDDFVEWAVKRDLWGIENLSLIPGKVGAAPVQNIGAYGSEAKDTIQSVEMFCVETLNTLRLTHDHCQFGYRESIFKHSLKGRVIITSVVFELHRTPKPNLGYGDVIAEVEARGGATLRNIREAICDIRRRKLPDPAVTGNAGSFFKNPIVECDIAQRMKAENPDMPLYTLPDGRAKLAAGWLIDHTGLKGYKQGHVGVHDRQALVLVNLGGATGCEVIDFAHSVQAKVKAKFGVEIDTEVNII